MSKCQKEVENLCEYPYSQYLDSVILIIKKIYMFLLISERGWERENQWSASWMPPIGDQAHNLLVYGLILNHWATSAGMSIFFFFGNSYHFDICVVYHILIHQSILFFDAFFDAFQSCRHKYSSPLNIFTVYFLEGIQLLCKAGTFRFFLISQLWIG